ncbi:MAG: protein kinase, partial [Ignavibacterium sp.]
GMGVVYKAQDTKLDRLVALKFLPPHLLSDKEAEERFISEAKTASSFDHPNICTIHDIGKTDDNQLFIVMAYYEGETLKKKIERGPINIKEAIDIVSQVAEGLKRAHKKSIIHRDIKPANLFIKNDGTVKILDFGLAKVSTKSQLTTMGTTIGTVAYMSPEQTKGNEVDSRTDIWSLGVVFYEMLLAELPFKGDYEQAIIYSILNEEPALLTSLPAVLKRILGKSLQKNPVNRYQATKDLIEEFKAVDKSGSSIQEKNVIQTVAVLPFANMSNDKEQEYFCDGMTEDIINDLAHLEGLQVVARTSSFAFKDKNLDIREIGLKLGAHSIVEGSVRKAGNRLRITAQLVNVADGYHLWSERYDRELEDVFVIQEEISNSIVNELKIELTGEANPPVVMRSTNNLEAYDLYLKGRYFWNTRQSGGMEKAKQHFEKALTIDPTYALAYAGLADYYNIMGWYEYSPPMECFPKAKQSALKAIELGDKLAEAHSALAFAKWTFDWDLRSAEKGFKHALELNPNFSTAHMWYSNFLVMTGRTKEGFVEIEKALTIDPLSLNIKACSGGMFYLAGQYDRAVNQCKNTLEMNPDFELARQILTLTYEQQSNYNEAIDEGEKICQDFKSPQHIATLGYAYARTSNYAEAKKSLDKLINLSQKEYVSSYQIASIYSGLDDIEHALEWLEKAVKERSTKLVLVMVDPMFKNLHADARFKEILRKIGLEKQGLD